MKIFIDDELTDEKVSMLSILRESVDYKGGLFESLKISRGKICFFEEHIQRLKKSCNLINLIWDKDSEQIKDNAITLIKENELTEGKLKLEYFKYQNRYAVILTATDKIYSKSNYDNGISLWLSETVKNSDSIKSRIKSLNNSENLNAKEEALNLGYDEAFFLNEKSHLCECAVSNIFWIKEGCLYTPSEECGLLKGIVRDKIIDLSNKIGISCILGSFEKTEPDSADEVFVTNSIMGVMPVSKIETKHFCINNSKITKKIKEEYDKLLSYEKSNN